MLPGEGQCQSLGGPAESRGTGSQGNDRDVGAGGSTSSQAPDTATVEGCNLTRLRPARAHAAQGRRQLIFRHLSATRPCTAQRPAGVPTLIQSEYLPGGASYAKSNVSPTEIICVAGPGVASAAGTGMPSLVSGRHSTAASVLASEATKMSPGVMLMKRRRCRTPAFQASCSR